MKTSKFFLIVCFTIVSYTAQLKAQIALPYPISNNTGCDIEVAVEVWDANCRGCANGSYIIPNGGFILVGNNCGSISDIHVVLMAVDGVAVTCTQPGGASNSVGDTNNCTLSTAPGLSCSYPAGASCVGNFNMAYTTGGTSIW